MKSHVMRAVLAISLLINIGVFGTLAYRMLNTNSFPGLPRYLELSEEQIHHWHATEAGFLEQLATSTDAVRTHRERLIRAIFAETPDPTLIDTERTAIAQLQDEQQKQVIRQLLQERELLSPAQRTKLAQLLLDQPSGPSTIELLHRD
jgi:uncharacterized membrane protein YebE (DUF533 family)